MECIFVLDDQKRHFRPQPIWGESVAEERYILIEAIVIDGGPVFIN
jgi:hypothetical protein